MHAVEVEIGIAAPRVTSLLVAELDQAVERNEFGVVVRDVAPLDFSALADAIAQPRLSRQGRLRVTLVGEEGEVGRAIVRHASLQNLLASEEETAVGWRNQRLRTIAVITNRPLAKAASLRDFRVISEHDLARRLCREEREKAEVGWLRALWDVLERAQSEDPERGRSLRIALGDLVRFAAVLDALPAAARSAQAPRHLYVLGLFPDGHLADEKSDQRLFRRLLQNRVLVQQVRRAMEEDWGRIRAYHRTLSGPEKTAAGRLQRRLRDAAKGGSLEGIDFPDAQTLWRAKAAAIGPVGPEGGAKATQRVEVERAVGRMLMAEDEARLGDIAEEVRQVVQAALDDDVRSASQDIKQASAPEAVSVVDIDRDVLTLVRSRSTEREWGGVIEVASDRPTALTEVAALVLVALQHRADRARPGQVRRGRHRSPVAARRARAVRYPAEGPCPVCL